MAAFQIHEDIENIRAKFRTKKCLAEVDGKKITKKKFGESNAVVQQVGNRNGLRELPKAKIAVIDDKTVKEQVVNAKKMIKDDKIECNQIQVANKLVEDLVLQINDKENVEKEKEIKNYCPFSILHNEYGQDIYNCLRELEKKGPRAKPAYMLKQVELNWNSRSILVDWLVSVSDEYELSHETLHLSVNYIDRFLNSISVVKHKFQLLGAAAMRLASKMEEYQAFDAKEWAYLTGDCFTARQIVKMEQIVLKILEFNMKMPTMCNFIEHLSSECKMDAKTVHFALYISELVLLEGNHYLKYFPSKLAAASIALARFHMSKDNPWPEKLKKATGYSIKELSPVVQKQHKTLEESPMKQHKSIATKYKSSRFSRVALMRPRTLSLDCFENSPTDL